MIRSDTEILEAIEDNVHIWKTGDLWNASLWDEEEGALSICTCKRLRDAVTSCLEESEK